MKISLYVCVHIKTITWILAFLTLRILELFAREVCKFLKNTVDTGRKLNVHKTFRGRPGRLLNVLCKFNLRSVSTGKEANFCLILLFLNVCKQTSYISHVRMSQNANSFLTWHLRHIISMWSRSWQTFKSALVYF